MDSDPNKRPTAEKINLIINSWLDYINSIKNTLFTKRFHDIQKQFLFANMYISIFSSSQKHPNSMYTSKLINVQEITEMLSKVVSMEIPNEKHFHLALQYLINKKNHNFLLFSLGLNLLKISQPFLS